MDLHVSQLQALAGLPTESPDLFQESKGQALIGAFRPK